MKLDPTERSLRTGGHSRLETVATATEVLLGYGQGRAFSPPPPKRVIKEESGVRPRQRLKRTSKTEKVQTPSGLMADAQTGNQHGEVLHGPNLHQTVRLELSVILYQVFFFKGIKL